MPGRRKLLLIMLLSVSLVTTAVMGVKIYFGMRGLLGQMTLEETGYMACMFYTIEYVEHTVVIVMGCVPTLGPLTQMKLTDIPVLGFISRSLSSLWSRREDSSIKTRSQSCIYHRDLEMGPFQKLNKEPVVRENRRIVRIDEFSILNTTVAESTVTGTIVSAEPR